jgi:hypothetical protein
MLPKKATAKEIESHQDAVLDSEEKRIPNVDKTQSFKNTRICAFGNMASLAQYHPPKKMSLQTYLQAILRTMKTNLDHQYMVDNPSLKNVIVILIKDVSSILSDEEILCLRYISKLFNEVIVDVLWLRILDFSPLLELQLGNMTQESISQICVDLATAGMIHDGLHPGMLICYLKGEYTGKNGDIARIIAISSPYISKDNSIHVEQILMQGCPSKL